MNLADLKVGMDIVIINKKYVDDNMDAVQGGFIDRTTKKFFSDEMVASLCGKKHKIREIDSEDPVMNVYVNDFWLCSSWIEKEYVAPPKPKVAPARPVAAGEVPKKAADGTVFGVVFKKLLKAHPELGVLSTNRLTNLTHDEIENICNVLGLEFDEVDFRATCQRIFDHVING